MNIQANTNDNFDCSRTQSQLLLTATGFYVFVQAICNDEEYYKPFKW